MSTPVFQPGDKVRRIIDNWAGVKVGDIETVASMGGTYSPAVFLVGHSIGFMPSHFEMVEAAVPVMEPDPDNSPDPVAAFRIKLLAFTESGRQLPARGVSQNVPTDPAEFEAYADELAAIVRKTVLYVLNGETK
ncbi:MAG: hypothetical protein ABFE16_06130 [Armatimonadia bacterium]